MTARAIATIGLLLCVGVAMAQDKAKQDKSTKKPDEGEAKEVSGMSIVGNSETPKSLTIIPWKRSEIGTTKTPGKASAVSAISVFHWRITDPPSRPGPLSALPNGS